MRNKILQTSASQMVVPRAAACVSPGGFLEMQIPPTAPTSNPRPTESKPLVQGPAICVLISPEGDSHKMIKLRSSYLE